MTSNLGINFSEEEIAIKPPLFVRWREGSGYLCRISTRSLTIDGILTEVIDGVTVHVGGKKLPVQTNNCDLLHRENQTRISYHQDNPDLNALLALLRKEQHIELCLSTDVEASTRLTGFENIHFIPRALPELNFDDVSLSSQFLGRHFDLPFLITGMTGGVVRGGEINRRLAVVASKLNIPMGVGSQRVALEHPEQADQFRLKHHAPSLFLIGNLGIAQLIKGQVDLARRAIEMIDADAIAIHINILQEAIQPEGDRLIVEAYRKIEDLVKAVRVPVIVKEVGCGLDQQTARRLLDVGVKALDVGGSGGTSWGWIEGLRGQSNLTQNLGREFRNWGIPTAHALAGLANLNPSVPLIATGGIRGGIMAAKALALGASMVGVGLPLFRAASESEDAALELLSQWSQSLKRVLWATNSRSAKDLAGSWTIGLPYESELEKLLGSQMGIAKETKS